jgi:peptide/nickel transport system permease protein
MRNYIIKRLLLAVPAVFIVSLIIFFIIRLIPGNVIDLMVSDMGSGPVSDIDKAKIEHDLGLDKPFISQYGIWLKNIVLHGDLGNSLWDQETVVSKILERFPVTFELGILGLIIAQLIALPIGIYSALRQDTIGDYIARTFAILCIAIPSFWLATLVIVFPSIWWGYSPPLRLITFPENPIGNLKMFILPAIVLGMSMAGMTMRMTRTMMLEVLRQDYIRTAWAKGLRERAVVVRHALKNALIPVITVIGMGVPTLIGGTVIIENIFSLPGMGRLIMDATQTRDYTLVSGVLLFFGVALVLINLLVDLTYGLLDPRIQYK